MCPPSSPGPIGWWVGPAGGALAQTRHHRPPPELRSEGPGSGWGLPWARLASTSVCEVQLLRSRTQANVRREEWGGGRGGGSLGTKKVVYLKWPDQIFLIENAFFPHDGPFGLGCNSLNQISVRGVCSAFHDGGLRPAPCLLYTVCPFGLGGGGVT